MTTTTPRNRFEDPAQAVLSFIRQVEDLDESWMPRGRCRDYPIAKNKETGFTWWMASSADSESGGHVPAERLATQKALMALMVCASCPVQYDCAEFGARSGASAGIYGVRTSNLNYIRKRRLWEDPQWGALDMAVETFVTIHRERDALAREACSA